jgi:hypothetical protein
MGDFKKLDVWRKAHALSLNVYRSTKRIRGAEHISVAKPNREGRHVGAHEHRRWKRKKKPA